MRLYRVLAWGVALTASLLLGGVVRAQDEGRNVSPDERLEEVSASTADGIRIPQDKIELHRLRIVNRTDGAIQVSTDHGATWQLIGRVVAPARTCAEGYIAAQYA